MFQCILCVKKKHVKKYSLINLSLVGQLSWTLYMLVEKFQICVSSLFWWTSVEVTCVSGVCLCKHLSVCVCVRMPLLVRQVSLSACASAAVALCVHELCCLPAGWAAVAGVAMRCVDYFLPYIAMTGHVVSPVVAGGQQCSSLHAPLPLSKTRTQVLPVGITWVSPYVFRSLTHWLEQQSCLSGTTGKLDYWTNNVCSAYDIPFLWVFTVACIHWVALLPPSDFIYTQSDKL